MKNKIAVLDDNRFIQMLIAEELEEEGYDVFTAGVGSQVVERIRGESPDLVVLDYNPKRIDNKSLVHNIKKSFSELPVILWTTYPFMIKSIKAMEADHYVYKNSDFSPLKRKIKSVLERGEFDRKPFARYKELKTCILQLSESEGKGL